MKPLPLPVRIAAGLVATAVEQVRELPRLVIELPVTAVSQALQTSMRVQQRVTELAIKGDRALGMLRPVEEAPSWATFDDEDDPGHNGSGTVTELRPQAATRIPVARPPVNEPQPPAETAAEVAPATTATAAEVAPAATAAAATGSAGADVTEAEAKGLAEDATGPGALPDYRDITIPQLRAHLRYLSTEDLRTLLEWETIHDNRPPFVTMLTNRITTVTEA